jgi:hypothetical protein
MKPAKKLAWPIHRWIVLILLAAGVVTGCGGGGGGGGGGEGDTAPSAGPVAQSSQWDSLIWDQGQWQ